MSLSSTTITAEQLAKVIDHSLLRPELTRAEVIAGIELALRANVGPDVQVKAAGGVRTLDALLAVIDAGCTRCGATATAVMLDEFRQRQKSLFK